jgi:hypothetical protein
MRRPSLDMPARDCCDTPEEVLSALTTEGPIPTKGVTSHGEIRWNHPSKSSIEGTGARNFWGQSRADVRTVRTMRLWSSVTNGLASRCSRLFQALRHEGIQSPASPWRGRDLVINFAQTRLGTLRYIFAITGSGTAQDCPGADG